MSNQFLLINATAQSLPLQDGSVETVISSPPFFGLRAYGTFAQVWGGDALCEHIWRSRRRPWDNRYAAALVQGLETRGGLGGKVNPDRSTTDAVCQLCNAWRGELGSEPTVEAYVANIVAVCREAKRVLSPQGVMWLEIGDSRSNAGRSNQTNTGGRKHDNGGKAHYTANGGIGEKQLLGVPFAVSFALQADGWVWRQWLPFIKRSAMPSSATDRPGDALSVWLMFTKQPRGYYFDMEAVRVAPALSSIERNQHPHFRSSMAHFDAGIWHSKPGQRSHHEEIKTDPAGRNYRNTDLYFASLREEIIFTRERLARLEALERSGGVLEGDEDILALDISSAGYKGQHFATYSEKLVLPLIRASCPPMVCVACGRAWRRVTENSNPSKLYNSGTDMSGGAARTSNPQTSAGLHRNGGGVYSNRKALGWAAQCTCNAPTRPGRCLDFFCGTGTTLAAAMREGRDGLGTDLSWTYLTEEARPRLAAVQAELEAAARAEAGTVQVVEADGTAVLATQLSWLTEVAA